MAQVSNEPFVLSLEALRARRCYKWNRYPTDVLPAWVADMDFAVAEPVQRAILQVVEQSDYGYGVGQGVRDNATGMQAAFADRMAEHFGWEVDPDRVQLVSELIQAMYACVMTFSEPGDGIAIQTPIYPPFLNTVADLKRRLVENRLVDDGTRFTLDVEGLRRVVDNRTRILMFCNPHNPTGRVFERDELLAVGQLAVERDLIVLSDEIHADLVYPGQRHIPIASLSPEIAARTITFTSATKGFNIAGLRAALMYFGSDGLRERFFRAIPERLLGQVNVIGIDATIAAWREGQPWLDAVMARLLANRDTLAKYVAEELPGVKIRTPEATYLGWLDCRDLCRDLRLTTSPYQFFLEQAKVGLNDGADFGETGQGCVRLNFATSGEILSQILQRMGQAVQERVAQPAT
ncbi:MAG: pyridoxal phosphate-dependent aminotransferase [Chloroflexi bacterium]|nr:pyridoxal phosphate-dependent aminotransferase [Chloroflexota bacterium]